MCLHQLIIPPDATNRPFPSQHHSKPAVYTSCAEPKPSFIMSSCALKAVIKTLLPLSAAGFTHNLLWKLAAVYTVYSVKVDYNVSTSYWYSLNFNRVVARRSATVCGDSLTSQYVQFNHCQALQLPGLLRGWMSISSLWAVQNRIQNNDLKDDLIVSWLCS